MNFLYSHYCGTALTEPQHTNQKTNKHIDLDGFKLKALFLKIYFKKTNNRTLFIILIITTSVIIMKVILTFIVT